MAGGGRIKIKGGVASRGEALVIDGALAVEIVGGGGGGGGGGGHRLLHFFGQADGTAITSVDVMDGSELGVVMPVALTLGAVAVTLRHTKPQSVTIGDWTLTILKNGVSVGTFTVGAA